MLVTVLVVVMARAFVMSNFDLSNFPRNNVSNSACFRAKIDHASRTPESKACTFLISGSSMSLNNISGKIIRNRSGEHVYNFSSWNLKPQQTLKFLKSGIIGTNVKIILLAFNNDDFGKAEFTVDYGAAVDALSDNFLTKYWTFIKTFNITTFFEDIEYRTKFAHLTNTYESVDFDETGSRTLDRAGFNISRKRWGLFSDSTGFSVFLTDTKKLHTECEKHNIKLYLVYLPTRPDLLGKKYADQNSAISRELKDNFGNCFIELWESKIIGENYCDGTHLFTEGAEYLTNVMMDSLQVRKCGISFTQ